MKHILKNSACIATISSFSVHNGLLYLLHSQKDSIILLLPRILNTLSRLYFVSCFPSNSTHWYIGCDRERKVRNTSFSRLFFYLFLFSICQDNVYQLNFRLWVVILMRCQHMSCFNLWQSCFWLVSTVLPHSGETVLHKAASLCQRTICHYLVEAGASLMKTDLQVRKTGIFFIMTNPHVRLTSHSSNNMRQGYLYTKKRSAVSNFSTDLLYAMWQKKAKQIHYRVQDGSDFLIIPLNFPMCVTGLAQRPLEKLLL